MICGCYRRDEAHDPDTFASALALILADYPAEVVRVAVDPRTGVITEFPMGLPNVGQIKQFLDVLQERRDRLQRYEALPKFERRIASGPVRIPNLFVPIDSRHYERIAAKAEKEPELVRFEQKQLCHDGKNRVGYWVPLGWLEDSVDKSVNKG